MGTALTGTTPQDTYDSLIKVTDNGPLSGSLKVLTDGLGNNSALSLSTAAASVTGTLAVTTGTNLATTSGSVGIGLSSPTAKLEIQDAAAGAAVKVSNSGGGSAQLAISSNATSVATLSFTNSLTISGGNVGIGTSTPATALDVNGALQSTLGSGGVSLSGNGSPDLGYVGYNYYNVSGTETATLTARNSWRVKLGNGSDKGITFDFRAANAGAGTFTEYVRIQDTGGISFNGDTAAANALDDYEEGTWTMGVSFGGASVGVTTSSNTGTYTKIGRQVTVNGFITLTSKGSSTGNAAITGLPFTIANTTGNYSAPALWFNEITFANQLYGNGTINTTTISLQEITILGVNSFITNADFANNSGIIVGFTYFV